MDYFARSRSHATVLLAGSLISLFTALALRDGSPGSILQVLLLFLGLLGTVVGAVLLALGWDTAKRYARLKAGQGVIARWTVSAERWVRFRETSSGWDRRADLRLRPNNANLGQAPGTNGIEIVVTGEGILIGASFYPLEKNVSIRYQPEWIEFDQYIENKHRNDWHMVLRLPLGADVLPSAELIKRTYAQAYTVAAGSSRYKIYALLLLLVGLPALTGVIVLLVNLWKGM